MLESCPESCAKITLESNINSIYDIVETDIVGKTIPFSDFKGSILYIVNVASRCGYTAENYETFRHLSKYRDEGVYTILAPCNQVRPYFITADNFHDGPLKISMFNQLRSPLLVRSTRAWRCVRNFEVYWVTRFRWNCTKQVWCERCRHPPSFCISQESDWKGLYSMVSLSIRNNSILCFMNFEKFRRRLIMIFLEIRQHANSLR